MNKGKQDPKFECCCLEHNFFCLFCKSEYKHTVRDLKCPLHSHLGLIKLITCTFCHR